MKRESLNIIDDLLDAQWIIMWYWVSHTSLDNNGSHIVELLSKEPEIKVLKIFSPEHGYRGIQSAGEWVKDDSFIQTVQELGAKRLL